MSTKDSAMFARFLFAAVLLAGCSAPVIRPSPTHSADCESGCQTGICAARTDPRLQPGLHSDLRFPLTSGFVDTVDFGIRDTTWFNRLPSDNSACVVSLVIFLVVIIASATFWR